MQATSKETGKRQLHFAIEIGGIPLVYLYIRKNACSAWKKLFVGESQHKAFAKSYKNPINFMGKFHKVKRIDKIARTKNRIVVLRNPLDRFVSGYINQYVMRLNRTSDLHKKVQDYTGLNYYDISFKDFVEKYLLKATDEYLDAHFWSQKSHMCPIKYNHVWPIENLHTNSKELLGEKIADRYFLMKVNSTSYIPNWETEAHEVTAKKLFKQYENKHMLPSKNSFLTAGLREAIEQYYHEDVALYKSTPKIDVVLNETNAEHAS